MSIQTPNLDDRTWQDITNEAKRLIPQLCPTWTDLNPSDPGVTLMELMAWMTEILLYRLNRVPDKIYFRFLELLGIDLIPPQPAETWIEFKTVPTPNIDNFPEVPLHTRVSGIAEDGEKVIFETTESFNLNGSHLIRLFAQHGERYQDRTATFLTGMTSRRFNILKTEHEIPHMFYIGDPAIAMTGDDFVLKLYVILETPGRGLQISWSIWDGEKWLQTQPSRDETDNLCRSGEISFNALPPMKETHVFGFTSFWLRMELSKYSGEQTPRIFEFKKTLELKKESGIVPDRGYNSTEEIPFLPIVFQGVFFPFGRTGKINDALYISSDAFSRCSAPVTIDIRLADSYLPLRIEDIQTLELSWEYYSRSGEWLLLGVTSPIGVTNSRWGFNDASEAFTHSGKITFYIPNDIAKLDINGEIRYWIRSRIIRGSFSIKKKLNPPICTQILILYKESPSDFNYYVSYNEFQYAALNPLVENSEIFEPFIPVQDKQPEFYMGFDKAFTNKLHRLYLRLVRHGSDSPQTVWEYPAESGWKKLTLYKDGSNHLTRQGMVEFFGPPDWKNISKFGDPAYWLRVRWEKTGKHQPRLRAIHLNMVKAIQAFSFRDEILGASSGHPFQVFFLKNSPIISSNDSPPKYTPRILVRELCSSLASEITDFKKKTKEEVVEEKDPASGRVIALWVLWSQTPNFFSSGKDSRHYILDYSHSSITFGDNINGMIPPVTGAGNIKCDIYYTGGGLRGNVGRNMINAPETPIPYVDKVNNPYPAAGGADRETPQKIRERAPSMLKHLNRAVTAEDFEILAKQASTEIGLASCRPSKEGVVRLIIIPTTESNEEGGRLSPSSALIDKVREYLEPRRLITTQLEITGPSYREFSISSVIALKKNVSDQSEEIKQQITEKLTEFFNPLKGGLNGGGWPMGRSVHLSEIYYIIDNVKGVDYVSRITLDNNPAKEKVDIAEDQFPFLTATEIKISG